MNKIMESGRPAEILLVEDSEDDVILTRKGFESSRFAVNLHHVENGVECLAFLRKEEQYATAKTPDLILLDLNMPLMDGHEVLKELVKDDQLRQLPVVVLTSSASERDILKMYDLRCSSYIVKPIDFLQFQRIVEELGRYWFSIVVVPEPVLNV